LLLVIGLVLLARQLRAVHPAWSTF